jgi:Zn-dependent protease with chaperone function
MSDATQADLFDDFIELLEGQHRSHKSKCAMFTLGFVAFMLLAVAVGLVVVLGIAKIVAIPNELTALLGTLMVPVLGFAMLFLSAWMGAESCLSALDASLFAARRRNQRLLEKLFDRIECTSSKKKEGAIEAIRTIAGV